MITWIKNVFKRKKQIIEDPLNLTQPLEMEIRLQSKKYASCGTHYKGAKWGVERGLRLALYYYHEELDKPDGTQDEKARAFINRVMYVLKYKK